MRLPKGWAGGLLLAGHLVLYLVLQPRHKLALILQELGCLPLVDVCLRYQGVRRIYLARWPWLPSHLACIGLECPLTCFIRMRSLVSRLSSSAGVSCTWLNGASMLQPLVKIANCCRGNDTLARC